MPRYLAIDYLAQAVKDRRAAAFRLQLPIPHHLETIEAYAHRGRLSDCSYRKPWTRVNQDKHVFVLDPQRVNDDLSYLTRHLSQLESYTCGSYFNQAGSSVYEVIPSSNPNSQESLEDEVLARLAAADSCDVITEQFNKYTLNDIQQSTSPEYEEMTLEEVASEHDLEMYVSHLPAISALCNRLPTLQMPDPLADIANLTKKFEGWVRSDQQLLSGSCGALGEGKSYQSLFEDEVTKEQLWVMEIEPLEERLSLHGDSSKELDDCDDPVDLSTPSCTTLIQTLTEQVIDTDQDEKCMVDEYITSRLVGICKLVDGPEHLEPRAQQWGCMPFTTLNSYGVSDSQPWQEKAILEFPIEHSTSLDGGIQTDIKAMCNELSVFSMPPVEEGLVLTSSSQERLEEELWNREKFLNDVIMLCLTEPQVRTTPTKVQLIKETQAVLKLREDNFEELLLPWTLIDEGYYAMAASSPLEKISGRKCLWENLMDQCLEQWTKLTMNAPQEDEKIEEFSLQHAHQDRETDIGIPSLESGSQIRSVSKHEGVFDERPKTPKIQASTDPVVGSGGLPTRTPGLPLDDFIWMRTGQTGISQATKTISLPKQGQQTPAQQKPVAKTPPLLASVPKQEGCRSTTEMMTPVKTPVTGERMEKSKSRVIDVKLTADYRQVIDCLEKGADSLLRQLQAQGLLPANQSLHSLTPGITRFILKQHQKMNGSPSLEIGCHDETDHAAASKDISGKATGSGDGIFPAVLGLHAVVGSLDVLLHGCLASSVAHLSAVQQKYGGLPPVLDDMRCHLLEIHFAHEQRHIRHPKVLEMCEVLTEWLKKREQQSPSHDYKMLVILGRDLPSLAQCLKKGLQMVEGVRPDIYPSNHQATYPLIMNRLEKYNCLVLLSTLISEDFPWAQFSFVLEYEYKDSSPWQETCDRQKISFVGLQMTSIAQQQCNTNNLNEITVKELAQIAVPEEAAQFTFIGSTVVTTNSELLQLLEARHNILILERDYGQLRDSHQGLYFSDIVIDERTCILLQDLGDLTQPHQVSPLITRLAALSLKYTTCWVLLQESRKKGSTKEYAYAGNVTMNLAKLHATATHLLSVADHYNVHVVLTDSAVGTASMVRQIGELTHRQSQAWSTNAWLNRSWLNPTMSQEERCLLSFPCLNTFSAQLLLTLGSLTKVLTLEEHHMPTSCPWLPPKVAQMFTRCLHQPSGLLQGQILQTDGNDTSGQRESENPQDHNLFGNPPSQQKRTAAKTLNPVDHDQPSKVRLLTAAQLNREGFGPSDTKSGQLPQQENLAPLQGLVSSDLWKHGAITDNMARYSGGFDEEFRAEMQGGIMQPHNSYLYHKDNGMENCLDPDTDIRVYSQDLSVSQTSSQGIRKPNEFELAILQNMVIPSSVTFDQTHLTIKQGQVFSKTNVVEADDPELLKAAVDEYYYNTGQQPQQGDERGHPIMESRNSRPQTKRDSGERFPNEGSNQHTTSTVQPPFGDLIQKSKTEVYGKETQPRRPAHQIPGQCSGTGQSTKCWQPINNAQRPQKEYLPLLHRSEDGTHTQTGAGLEEVSHQTGVPTYPLFSGPQMKPLPVPELSDATQRAWSTAACFRASQGMLGPAATRGLLPGSTRSVDLESGPSSLVCEGGGQAVKNQPYPGTMLPQAYTARPTLRRTMDTLERRQDLRQTAPMISNTPCQPQPITERGKGVAPVTPKIRQQGQHFNLASRPSMYPSQALRPNTDPKHRPGFSQAHPPQAMVQAWMDSSPPMDLSQEAQDYQPTATHRHTECAPKMSAGGDSEAPSNSRQIRHDVHTGPPSCENGRTLYGFGPMRDNPKLMQQKKLTYTKIPGAPNGQTQLKFT